MSRSRADGGTKFIILCAARTGSTMLQQLLDSHPEVCCYGEIMAAAVTPDRWDSEARIRRQLLEQYRQGPRQFLREFGLYPPECNAVGFKIKYEELVLGDYAWLLAWLKDHRDIKVIHHRRENRLKRLISVVTATQIHGVFNVRSERDLPAAAKVRLTVGECLDDFARTEGREIVFREYFRDHAMLETTYEAVVASRDGVRERMADFLGVAPARLTTPTLKINPDDVRQLLEEYEAFAEAFRGTAYGWYLGV
jgi:LPS sulfotransferase NodH